MLAAPGVLVRPLVALKPGLIQSSKKCPNVPKELKVTARKAEPIAVGQEAWGLILLQ